MHKIIDPRNDPPPRVGLALAVSALSLGPRTGLGTAWALVGYLVNE